MTGYKLRIERNRKLEIVDVDDMTDGERHAHFRTAPREELTRWIDGLCNWIKDNVRRHDAVMTEEQVRTDPEAPNTREDGGR